MPPKRSAEDALASAAVDLLLDANGASSSSNGSTKRLRTMSSAFALIAKQCTCPISQELMVDPVLAEDGNTYDRDGIEQCLQTNTTSPLDPSCTLTIEGLRPNRTVREAVETLVESGELDDDTSAAWLDKK